MAIRPRPLAGPCGELRNLVCFQKRYMPRAGVGFLNREIECSWHNENNREVNVSIVGEN